jgi:hypothetical protein
MKELMTMELVAAVEVAAAARRPLPSGGKELHGGWQAALLKALMMRG